MWTFDKKFIFAIQYFLSKMTLFKDVKKPRWKFWVFELRYSLQNMLRHIFPSLKPLTWPHSEQIDFYDISFIVRGQSHDAAIVSPAFEKPDYQSLVQLIQKLGTKHQPIHFFDIGANIGAFTVRLARQFPDLKIYSFEPHPDNFKLLRQNLLLNKITSEQVQIFQLGISSKIETLWFESPQGLAGDSKIIHPPLLEPSHKLEKDTKNEGRIQQQIKTAPLKDFLNSLDGQSHVVIKMDIEGHELEALKGFGNQWSSFLSTTLLIEDMILGPEIERTCSEMGFEFMRKITPYNSWYQNQNHS